MGNGRRVKVKNENQVTGVNVITRRQKTSCFKIEKQKLLEKSSNSTYYIEYILMGCIS